MMGDGAALWQRLLGFALLSPAYIAALWQRLLGFALLSPAYMQRRLG